MVSACQVNWLSLWRQNSFLGTYFESHLGHIPCFPGTTQAHRAKAGDDTHLMVLSTAAGLAVLSKYLLDLIDQ